MIKKYFTVVFFNILFFIFTGICFGQDFQISDVRKIEFKYNDQRNLEYPKWSSDCEFISFESRQKDNIDLHVFIIDRGEVRDISSFQPKPGLRRRVNSTENEMVWKNNTQFCFIGTGSNERPDIYAGDIFNNTVNILQNLTENNRTRNKYSVLRDLRISPEDNDILLFMMGGKNQSDLFYYDITSIDEDPITRITSSSDTLKMHPSFSPNGNNIIFAGERKGDANIFQSQLRRNTSINCIVDWESTIELMPSYSPDGKYISFISTPNKKYGKNRLFVMDENGENLVELFDDIVTFNHFGYLWYPRGRYIFFIKNSPEEDYPLCYVNVETREVKRLAIDYVNIQSVSISPDCRKITFSSKGKKTDPNYTWSSIYYGNLSLR